MGFLQETVVSRALDHNRLHDWTGVVPQKAIHGARLAHLASLCGLAAVSIVLASRAGSDPGRDRASVAAAAARFAEIQVTPGDTEIEKGSSLLVVARFPGAVPPEAKLVVEDGVSASASHAMTRSLEDPTFAGRVESVVNDLSYHVEFAGESSPTYRVRIFENPELVRTDAKLDYPAYTSIEPKTAEDIRHVTAVEGTKLTLLFRLNKEVASAKLVDEKGQEDRARPAGRSGGARLQHGVHAGRFAPLQGPARRSRGQEEQAFRQPGRERDAEPSADHRHEPARRTTSRVSPVEELRLKSQVSDDFGVVRHGVSFTTAGTEPRDVVLSDAAKPRPKRVQVEHLIDFEALKAVPDQLVTYFVWAEDFGPDGKPRRTEGDMYFAEVRHFEEIFRQGEQPSSASAENEQDEQGGGNARQAEQLAELQKEDHQWHLEGHSPRDRRPALGQVRPRHQGPARVAGVGRHPGGGPWGAAAGRVFEGEPGEGREVDEGRHPAAGRGLRQGGGRLAAPGPRRRAGRLPGVAQAEGARVRGRPQATPASGSAAAEARGPRHHSGSSISSSSPTGRIASRSRAGHGSSSRRRSRSSARRGRSSAASRSWPSARPT